VFKLARQLKPTILFLEDLDLYAGERASGGSVTLGELLSQMDGLEENDGLIVVATTNDLEVIEPAMRDRPSRFDVVLEVGLPEADARRQILTRALARQKPTTDLIERAVAETAGLSGAQLQEVAIVAIQRAIFRGDVDAEGIARVLAEDLAAAVDKLAGTRKQPIGFGAQAGSGG
jgi:SpoVK/Ycf46/Vps4 family AAA+-type ATPase